MADTLILNADGMPLSVVPLSTQTWEDSIKLMLLERADVLATYDDWEVHSPSAAFKVPSVMLERQYIKVSRGIKFSRENLYLRDLYTCQYCGLDCRTTPNSLTLDHVIPRFHGGKTRWDNCVAACGSCNLEKAHFMKMQPKIAPKRPGYHELVAKRMTLPILVPHASWGDFLGWAPELVTVREPTNRPGMEKLAA